MVPPYGDCLRFSKAGEEATPTPHNRRVDEKQTERKEDEERIKPPYRTDTSRPKWQGEEKDHCPGKELEEQLQGYADRG